MKRYFLLLALSIVIFNSNLYSQLKAGGRTHEGHYFSVAVSPSWGITELGTSDTYHGFDFSLDLRAGESIGKGFIAYGNVAAGRLFGNLLGEDTDYNPNNNMPDRVDIDQITVGGGVVRYLKSKFFYYSLSMGATSVSANKAAHFAPTSYFGYTVNFRAGFSQWVSESICMENGFGLSYSPLYGSYKGKDVSVGLFKMTFCIAMAID